MVYYLGALSTKRLAATEDRQADRQVHPEETYVG